MASAGGGSSSNNNNGNLPAGGAGQTRRVIRIPLPRGIQPGQGIRIRFAPPVPGQQGGPQPQIRIVQLPVRPHHQQANGGDGVGGGGGGLSRDLREQEAAARRAAEESHRRMQIQTTLNTIQKPEVEYSEDEGVVRVSWQPVVVTGDDAVEYTVRGWKDGAGEPVIIYQGQLTSCVVTTETLCRGHTHQVAVSASVSGVAGEPSARSEVQVPALAPAEPHPPKIVSRTKNSLGLRWNAPANNGSPITTYSLEWDQFTGDYKEVYLGKKREYKFSQKLPPGSQNLFRVRAQNIVGWSDFSEDLVHNVSQAPPPAPPTPSVSSRMSNSLTVNWTTPTGAGSVTSYCLEMDDPNSGYGFCPVYQGDGLSYTCRDLQRVTVYNFRLTALNQAGSSPSSPPVSFTTLPEPPGVPGDIFTSKSPRSTSISLEWSPPVNDGGSPIDSYILQTDGGDDTGEMRDVYKGSEVNYILESLSPGRNYRFRVSALSSGGQSAWSNEAMFKTPPTLPRPPTGLRAMGKITLSSAIITWNRPESDGGAAVISYTVQILSEEEADKEWETVATVPEQHSFSRSARNSSPVRSSGSSGRLSRTLTHLTPGTSYSVRINCNNSIGESEWSESISLTTTPGPPAPPENLSLTSISAHSAHLQWTESREFGSEVSGYEVEWGVVGGASHVMPLPQSPCVASLSRLSADTVYTARMKALSESGESNWSSSLTFTTAPSTPSPPSHLALVSATPNSVLVAWSVPPSPGSPLSQYHIHLLPTPPEHDSAPLVVPPSETQLTLPHLEPNTQYTVRVQAENGVGLGQLSSPLLARTLPPPPLPPSLSLVSCTSNSLRVSWGGKRIPKHNLSYTLQISSSSSSAESDRFHTAYSGTGVGHKLQRLSPATQYSLRIATTSESGQGAWSDLLTCETLPLGPNSPRELMMRQKDDVIVMSWEIVDYHQPLNYELQLKTSSGQDFIQVYRGSTPSHTHTITNYTTFQARVRACASCHANGRSEQLFSGFSPVATCNCLAPPTTEESTVSTSNDSSNNIPKTIGVSPNQQNQVAKSQNWLLLVMFVGVSISVVVIAILLGKLFVASSP